MSGNLETNIENNSDGLFRPHLQKAKSVVFGDENPDFFTQFVFFAGMFVSFIFLIWHGLSLAILKFPEALKTHKNVDVQAIINLRARELGFENMHFYDTLEIVHLISLAIWAISLVTFFFVWRKVRWANGLIICCLLTYTAVITILLGPTYFFEDTTTFDKIVLLFLFLLVLAKHLLMGKKIENKIEQSNTQE